MIEPTNSDMNAMIRQAAGRGEPEPEPEPAPDEPTPVPDLGQGARPMLPATQAVPMNANLRAHLSAHRRRPLPEDYRR